MTAPGTTAGLPSPSLGHLDEAEIAAWTAANKRARDEYAEVVRLAARTS